MKLKVSLFILIFGCFYGDLVFADSDSIVVNIPVLNSCVNDAQARIASLPSKLELTAKYIEFSRTLQSAPQLAGFIQLSSQKYDKGFLIRMGNGFITNCDINTTILFEEKDAKLLYGMIRTFQAKGITNFYMVPEKNGIRLLFKKNEP